MGREEAYFRGSRLYRQASEGARHFFDHVEAEAEPFGEVVQALWSSSGAEISTLEELGTALQQLENLARQWASEISTYHALPLLFEATDQAYYGGNEDWRPYGPGLKTAACIIYPNVFDLSARARTASLDAVRRTILACALLVELQAVARAWEHARDGRLVIGSSQIGTEGDLSAVLSQFALAYVQRGRVQRLASHAARAVTHLGRTIVGVQDVLAGVSPGASQHLHGTILGCVQDTNPAFWAGLLMRLSMLGIAGNSRAQAGQAQEVGLAILGPMGVSAPDVGGVDFERALGQVCCSPDWYAGQSTEMYVHLPVRRPIFRITADEELYATSIGSLADSITSYLERAFFREDNGADWLLHEDCFRSLISEPFEEDTVSVFRRAGFLAGRVTDRGYWTHQEAAVSLAQLAGIPPGEIDVLAYHRNGMLVVAECKVLGLPFQRSRLRNLISKLGEADSESFRAKLRSKLRWAQRALSGDRHLMDDGLGIIVLDQFVPGPVEAPPELVVTLEDLEPALRHVVRPWRST
jgi:hypothetical protein